MTPKEFEQHLKKKIADCGRFVNVEAPIIAGETAVDMFKENFQTESYFGKPWREVQRRMDNRNFKTITRGKNKGERQAKGWRGKNKILTGTTGDLGRSISYKAKKNGVVRILSAPNEFTNGNYYAQYHNEGTKTIPQRQFMGNHPKVNDKIMREIKRKLDLIVKG